MRKFIMVFTAVTLALGTMAMTASAQTQAQGAASFPENATPFVKQAAWTSFTEQLKNPTAFVKRAACNGTTGSCGCGPGWVTACPNRCCHCVPCY
jgi:hypothetical protein